MLQRGRLRQIREERGLSQGKLGKCIGQDGQYISKLESGVRSGVTSTTLARLAVALGISSDFLLGLDDTSTRAPGTLPAQRSVPVPYAIIPEGLMDSMPASVGGQTDVPSSFPLCPHCAVPMQPMTDGRGIACRACRYTVEGGL
jgi:transcriptional regulator with XRE-family HTH domain